MISSKMNRTNGGSRSSRIFAGILLVTIACLVVLYYHEHRSAKDAEAISTTLEQQTRTLDESVQRFNALKNACREDREQLTKTNQEQEAQIQTALQQAQDWQQRYERVISDKNTMESELARLKNDVQSLQQKFDDKQNEVSAVRGEMTSKMQQCEKDKQVAADEIAKFEKSKCVTEKQQAQQLLLQEKQQLQHQLDQCENSVKSFSDQLRKDTEQQGISSHAEKSVSLPTLEDNRHQKAADNELEEEFKAKLLRQFTNGDQGNVLSTKNQQPNRPPPFLPDNSKDLKNYFKDKQESSDKEIGISNYFAKEQLQQQQQQLQPSVSPLPVDKSPPSDDNHMIHIGISHVKNDSNTAELSDASLKKQYNEVNKTDAAKEEDDSHDDYDEDDDDDNDDDNGHVGEAEDDGDDHHHGNFDHTVNDDTASNQNNSFDKLLFDDGDDNGNHGNAAETDQDLLNIPRLTL